MRSPILPIAWNSELDTGIDVIDQQHRRIVDYINALEAANAGVAVTRPTAAASTVEPARRNE